jgi:predicted choloylglycine hydrolase
MLSYIKVAGSPFEAGRILGRFGAEAAHSYLIHSRSWASVMLWRGTSEVRAMVALTEQHFPLILEELTGLSAGLDLPFEDVFLWNCRGDVWAMAADGCTTVQLPQEHGARIAHNEDGDPAFTSYCGIAQVSIAGSLDFASFVYPASIPGHTFAVNEAGLAMTVNNLRSREVSMGLPRMVLTRALLEQTSLTDAVALLSHLPKAGGFHLSLAQQGRDELLSVEFNGFGVSAEVLQAPGLHANHATHLLMRDFPQVITDSSLHRQLRGNSLLGVAPNCVNPLAILQDQYNAQFPIYRDDPDDSDGENTMATVDIHIGKDGVLWQVYERPGQPARFEFMNEKLA